MIAQIHCRDYFYPMSPHPITTFLEATYGVSCWYTLEFTEYYKIDRLKNHWIEFETTSGILIAIESTIVYSNFQ